MNEPLSGHEPAEPRRAGLVIPRMGVGQLLDTGINLARRNYRALVIVVAWAIVPAYAVAAIVRAITGGSLEAGIRGAVAGDPGELAAFGALSGMLAILVTVASAVATGAITIGYARVIEAATGDDQLEPASLYPAVARRIWSLVLLFALLFVMAIPLAIVFPLLIYLYVRWSLSGVTLLIEGLGPIDALRRSWHLTSRAWWHTVGVLLAGAIVFGLLSLAFSSVGGFIAGSLQALAGSVVLSGLVRDLVSALNAILLTPFTAAYLVVLYYELRARNEGYDLQVRAAQVPIAG